MTGCNTKVAVVDDGESPHRAIHTRVLVYLCTYGMYLTSPCMNRVTDLEATYTMHVYWDLCIITTVSYVIDAYCVQVGL